MLSQNEQGVSGSFFAVLEVYRYSWWAKEGLLIYIKVDVSSAAIHFPLDQAHW